MSELPDRTPARPDEDAAAPPRAVPASPGPSDVGPVEEPTVVHRTASPAGDAGTTGFTPSPGHGDSLWGHGPAPSGTSTDGPGAPAAKGTAAAGPAAPAGVPAPPPVQAPTGGGAAPATAPVAHRVSVRNRGRMRRRLRYLRRVRELGYRDLGGLVFELRRARAENEILVGAKVDALHAIDQELHALEHGLRDFRSVEELHEPGVSVCLRCGALHGSDANFCPQCGIRVDLRSPGPAVAEPATVVTGRPPGEAAAPDAPSGSR